MEIIMKFKNTTKNLLSEMDMASTSGMKRNDKFMSDGDESARIRIMKKMGATPDAIARWKSAQKKGISFESFLVGLIDELKNSSTDGVDFDSEWENRKDFAESMNE